MSKTLYTPNLEVTELTTITKLRELPIEGEVLVKEGDIVNSNTPVLKAELPSDLEIINLEERLNVDLDLIENSLKVKLKEEVKKGDILCSVKTFFNLFKEEVKSPIDGVIEFYTKKNSHLGIRPPSTPLIIDAYINGEVIKVIEKKSVTIKTTSSFIQGIFGVGGENHGILTLIKEKNDEVIKVKHLEKISSKLSNSILVGGASFSIEAIKYLTNKNVKGVVTGSIDSKTLRDYIGFDIGVSITGDEKVPFPLIITEGFGKLAISKRITDLAKKLEGNFTSICGATQVRAGAMRPELIIKNDTPLTLNKEKTTKTIKKGAAIRIIREPYFGYFGKITDLPKSPQKIETKAKVKVVEVKLNEGNIVKIPKANIELI